MEVEDFLHLSSFNLIKPQQTTQKSRDQNSYLDH